MKKITILCLLMALKATMTLGQFSYDFSTYQSPYVRLTNDSVVSKLDIWQFRNYSMELGFNFKLDGITTTEFNFYYCNLASRVLAGISSGFHITDAQLVDKGNATSGPAMSPISFVVTGAAGSRIFKLQLANAGFMEEWVNLGTVNDSMSAQVWYYEGSNIVEIHYGPSRVSFPTAYYTQGGPLVGFIKNVNLSSTTPIYDKIYYLTGNPINPTLDSVGSTGFSLIHPITSLPPSGTVYKFTPKPKNNSGISGVYDDEEIIIQQQGRDILVNTPSDKMSYSIIAMDGRQVTYSHGLQQGQNMIDCSSYIPGIYLLKINTPQGQITRKIVMQ